MNTNPHNKFKVNFLKHFESGYLKGISVECSVSYPSLEGATRYIAFLHGHTKKPFKEGKNCTWTCSSSWIEVKEK